MIKQADVIEFFDRLAPTWDSEMVHSDEKIRKILDNAGVRKGSTVLDVACGTGVLIPDYVKREAAYIAGVDISPEMIRIAREKFRSGVRLLCGDIEQMGPDELADPETGAGKEGFDAVVVYNAFPHFPDPDRLIGHLSSLLKDGGVLTVAHGMSREAIDAHHKGSAHAVSMGLMEAEKLADIFSEYLEVETVISDEDMFQVAGRKRTVS